jgi:hypothetical protein
LLVVICSVVNDVGTGNVGLENYPINDTTEFFFYEQAVKPVKQFKDMICDQILVEGEIPVWVKPIEGKKLLGLCHPVRNREQLPRRHKHFYLCCS